MTYAPITWTDVTDVASELLVGVTSGGQTKILAYVEAAVAPDAFGGEDSPIYVLARAYLAAHYGLLNKQGSAAQGPVTSQSEGGVSQSFASLIGTSNDIFLGSTTYGRAFLSLVRRSGVARAGFTT